MKHLFIRSIVPTQAYTDANNDQRKKWFEEFSKFAKEQGFKLVFWGTPWGVPESLSIVLESEKSLDGYVQFLTAWSPKCLQLGLKPYVISSNTMIITAPE